MSNGKAGMAMPLSNKEQQCGDTKRHDNLAQILLHSESYKLIYLVWECHNLAKICFT